MSSTVTHLPERILNKTAEVHLLGDILKSFDPDSFELANTLYRKPSYQRGIKKSLNWNKGLINSILKGKAIGGIVMSKWTTCSLGKDKTPIVDIYFNIEDGGTRLGACKKFFEGKFEVEFGDINTPEIKEAFMNYRVAVELLSKAPRTPPFKDSIYFSELCENFSLLQEGKPLTASDRYAAMAANHTFRFSGSPIVNYTIKTINNNDNYKLYFGLSKVGPRDKNRNKLAAAVALVSGAMWGPKCANTQYGLHIPILYKEITDEMKQNCSIHLSIITEIIKAAIERLAKWKNEKFTSYFNNPTKFVGAMVADIWDFVTEGNVLHVTADKTFIKEMANRWITLINQWRVLIQSRGKKEADDWLERDIYSELDKANKRNSLEDNLVARMQAVKDWDYEYN